MTMRRSTLLIVPLVVYIPMVILLYFSMASFKIEDNYSLDLNDRKSIQSNVLHLKKVAPKRDSKGEASLGLQVHVNAGKKRFGNVTFPPFVEEINQWGPLGKAVDFDVKKLSVEQKGLYDDGWKKNSFNQYLSDRISVHRTLPHGWSDSCKKKKFRTDLPEVSVIIIFHNEAWSVLLRSVHSVLTRTPKKFLREIILVDDFSSFGYLKAPLDEYWRGTDRRVKVIHAAERGGLTRARLIGYKASTAPMVVFFDSHIECFPGWFEPLADRIATDPNITVFPSIEVIDPNNLQVTANHQVGVLGVFRWKDLTFQWGNIPDNLRQRSPADPIRSPTMPGGLFAISRQFFDAIGTYDPGLLYWGGENIELSFKAWMCYGSVELVPCSHVGHIFRKANPIKWSTNLGMANVQRVAQVWMDDYKNYFLEINLYNAGKTGDLSDRHALRKKLKCRDFAWYVKNMPSLPRPPLHVQHAGELKHEDMNKCLDSMGENSKRPALFGCHGQGGNQFWYISDGELLQETRRVCAEKEDLYISDSCHDKWNVTDTNQLKHTKTGKCLHVGSQSKPQGQHDLTLTLQTCDPGNSRQKWKRKPRLQSLKFPSFD